MLLRCGLIHLSIIILRHYIYYIYYRHYLLYLGPRLDLSLFMSYLCDLFFIFIFIFIMINRMNTDTFFLLLLLQNMSYCFWMITWIKNVNNFQIAKVQPQCVAQHFLTFLPISASCCL